MKLVSIKDIQTASNLDKWGVIGKIIAVLFYYLMAIPQINSLYNRVKSKKGKLFFDEIIKDQNIKLQVHSKDINRIPKDGPFILISNHPNPFDGVLLSSVVMKNREDYKMLANFLLTKMEPIQDILIGVNPFEQRKETYNSMLGMKQALLHLKNGGCLSIFPAGEISKKNEITGEIEDKEWNLSAIKLIKKAKVPVIPVYFHTKNSNWFYKLASIHPDIQTAFLPRVALGLKNKSVKIRIGKPIAVTQQEKIENINDYGDFLRKKVYMLKSFYEKKVDKTPQEYLKSVNFGIKKEDNTVDEIVLPTPQEKILEEVENLRLNAEHLLLKTSVYEVFLSKADKIPNILREIGRLREITFRSIGEGTNKSIDLDEFDNHYHHLFLWDSEVNCIVGAYRLGLGKEIYAEYGIKGFYVNTLFNFEPEIIPFFQKGIEMGRAFIITQYQQRPMPLFLLWKGIVAVCIKHPYYNYLVGGVSISNQFSNFSKSLLIEFMRSHYFDPFVGQFVSPKKAFKVNLTAEEREIFFNEIDKDINKLDKLIDELEPSSIRIPVLIKKYFKQNAKVIAFNVDPKFNDAIDGLMYIRIKDLPKETVQPVFEEMQEDFLKKKNLNTAIEP